MEIFCAVSRVSSDGTPAQRCCLASSARQQHWNIQDYCGNVTEYLPPLFISSTLIPENKGCLLSLALVSFFPSRFALKFSWPNVLVFYMIDFYCKILLVTLLKVGKSDVVRIMACFQKTPVDVA